MRTTHGDSSTSSKTPSISYADYIRSVHGPRYSWLVFGLENGFGSQRHAHREGSLSNISIVDSMDGTLRSKGYLAGNKEGSDPDFLTLLNDCPKHVRTRLILIGSSDLMSLNPFYFDVIGALYKVHPLFCTHFNRSYGLTEVPLLPSEQQYLHLTDELFGHLTAIFLNSISEEYPNIGELICTAITLNLLLALR